MSTRIWVGIKESDLDDVGILFQHSLTFFGSGKGKNIAFSAENGKRVNHNLDNGETSRFLAEQVQKLCRQYPDARFTYFSQYHVHTLPPQIKERCFAYNDQEILNLLHDKINARFWLASLVPIVPSALFSGRQCNLEELKKRFPEHGEQFVVQKNHSAGGYSTFLLPDTSAAPFSSSELLLVSPYIKRSIPLNVTAVIFAEEILLFPPSVQIIAVDNGRLLYKGADFISFRSLPELLKEKLREYAEKICRCLQGIGYRGVCGIDFIASEDEVYFMEVNERFQASTYLLNIALQQQAETSIQELSFKAFKNTHSGLDLSGFMVDYSNYIYTYHEKFKDFYPQQFSRSARDPGVFRLVSDGYTGTVGDYAEDAYLFSLVFTTNITSINFDHQINLADNIREHAPLLPRDVARLKFGLMNQGFQITDAARNYFERHGEAAPAINSGMDLVLHENIRVCSVFGDQQHKPLSPFALDCIKEGKLFLTFDGIPVTPVTYDPEDPLLGNVTSCSGIPFSQIAFLANRRLQINHEPVCFYQKNNISCKFCALPRQGDPFSLQDVFEVIDTYLHWSSFDHFLIGGASNAYAKGWDTIYRIAEYISSRSDKGIYLMTVPPADTGILKDLKAAGITEVAFNIEIFDRAIARSIMPGKGAIPIQSYFSVLEKAVELWGRTGAVRSMVMVGLEPVASLFSGLETLARMGVQPILSPFGPQPETELAQYIPFGTETLIWIYKQAVDICRPYGLRPGPDNLNGQNNTLSLPAAWL